MHGPMAPTRHDLGSALKVYSHMRGYSRADATDGPNAKVPALSAETLMSDE